MRRAIGQGQRVQRSTRSSCTARKALRVSSAAEANSATSTSVAPAAAPAPPASPAPAAAPAARPSSGLEDAFKNAYTMSQLYVKDRPAPIPLSQHEERRKKKDFEELCLAGKRRGIKPETIQAQMQAVDALIPGLINLHKAKAADWLAIMADANSLAAKLILLKQHFPNANMQKVVLAQPKLLMKSADKLAADAQTVRKALKDAADTIIEQYPELMDPISLSRSLANLQSTFIGQDPVQVLSKHPDVLRNMGEATVENVPDYGELSTKD